MWKDKMPSLTCLPGRSRVTRTFAGVLVVALLLGTIVPPFALAEPDNEGLGTAPPGARPPALEMPGVETAGEETQLGEVPVAPGEEEVEEVVPPAAGEEASEPAPPTVAPPAAAPEPEAPSAVAAPGPAPAPVPAQPSYETQEPTTNYEPAPTTGPPVRGEAIVEPGIGADSDPSGAVGQPEHPRHATVTQPAEESAPAPEPAEAPEQSTVPAPPSTPPEKPASLKGHRTYTVTAGDCLWTIAAAILPPTASDEQIAAEVGRLWKLNAERIGTGDPNVIDVGTVLRLP
jgi:hypothetical protein